MNEKYTVIPVPTIVLFVNDKHLMKDSYLAYLTNQFREAHPAPGIPVIFSTRSRRGGNGSHRKRKTKDTDELSVLDFTLQSKWNAPFAQWMRSSSSRIIMSV